MELVSVRMGEFAVSADPATVLVAIGLGSCIGLALVDEVAGISGLAHIMLPGPGDLGRRAATTFADTGVPALLAAIEALGARRPRAVLVGGAQMFGAVGASSMKVGQRNEEAVRAALDRAKIRVSAAETGGGTGRTIRIYVAENRVTSRTAGGSEVILLGQIPVTA
jgi:chemotaxis protein CheD